MKCNPWVGVSIVRRGFPMLGTGKRGLSTYVKQLFSNGEQGFVYDPNDLTTMFQDAAGIIPVTTVGQPVGIILDKSKGLVFGPELFNQVVDFSTWTRVSGGISASGNTFTSNGDGGYFKNLLGIGVSTTKTYQVRIVGTCTVAHVICNRSNYAGAFMTQAGDFDITVVAPLLFSNPSLYFYLQDTGTMTVNSISIKELAGNHAFQGVSASRPILRQNATTGAYYLEFDGADDFLQTNSIDFTATDKLSIFTAVKKNVDGVYGVIVEQGVDTDIDGYFVLATSSAQGYYLQNGNASNRSGFTMSGGASAPRSDVVVVSLDRSKADSTALRYSIESTELISTGVDIVGAGASGNFGNAPLFIGRRNGTSIAFNGRLYGLIICAALTSNEEVKAIKREMAKTIGV